MSANALAARGAPPERLRLAANPTVNKQMLRRPAAKWTAILLAALLVLRLTTPCADSDVSQGPYGRLQPQFRRPSVRRALLQAEPVTFDATSPGIFSPLPTSFLKSKTKCRICVTCHTPSSQQPRAVARLAQHLQVIDCSCQPIINTIWQGL